MQPQPARSLARQKFKGTDFSGQDLSHQDLSHSTFEFCNFDRANLTEANCEWSSFVGSSFRDTLCYRTNFKDAKLGATKFYPKDAFQCTLTMDCKTFENAEMGQLWWYAFLMFAASTNPASAPVKEDLKGKLIALIGAERYVKLKQLLGRRNI